MALYINEVKFLVIHILWITLCITCCFCLLNFGFTGIFPFVNNVNNFYPSLLCFICNYYWVFLLYNILNYGKNIFQKVFLHSLGGFYHGQKH